MTDPQLSEKMLNYKGKSKTKEKKIKQSSPPEKIWDSLSCFTLFPKSELDHKSITKAW